VWASLLVEELVRCGVNLFCIAPGSRSTPLVAAVSENPTAEYVVHYDERGTAFAALGHARATGLPAAWITTSGTAVANGLPAVVEASVDGVPMILVTADRPPELRQTGANQTVDQPDIFGDYVRWRFDLPAPSLEVDPAVVLTTVDQAVYRARRAPSGPVHLNTMFREPFLPEPGEGETLPSPWRGEGPFTRYAQTKPLLDAVEVWRLTETLRPVRRGVVVAGRLPTREHGEAVARLAGVLGWPLLPDVGSQVRLGFEHESAVPYYDALLADETFAGAHAPEAILHFGGRSLSKRLEGLVSRSEPSPYVVVRENPFRLDPHHRVTHSVEADVVALCAALEGEVENSPTSADASWAAGWREASQKVGERMGTLLSGGDLSEPLVARLVSRYIPEGHGLCVASSMPVRNLDAFAVAGGAPVPVAANRGASGIDGTVATAAGFARGLGAPVTLLIGDLALLHDLNSLALLRGLPVTVVVLNNDGGGIFHFLPVSRQEAFFEKFFGTPQGVGFGPAAEMFGLRYESPQTPEAFVEAYRAASAGGGSSILEVRTEREENVALHGELLRSLSG
jgi:2-succinyl-5-enolpyruvyl-6-hydroxy-3-cyclohexene-1-carboxylate synthase